MSGLARVVPSYPPGTWSYAIEIKGMNRLICGCEQKDYLNEVVVEINAAAENLAQEAYERGRKEMRLEVMRAADEKASFGSPHRNPSDPDKHWKQGAHAVISTIRSLPISRNQESHRAGGGGGK